MKTGRHSPKEEEARLKAARDAIGPDVELMVDCNNAWQDVTQAMQYIRRFEQYEPYFIEEPFGPDDVDSHAKLARLTHLPIATAEIGYGRWYHKERLDKQAASILQTDDAVCGVIRQAEHTAELQSPMHNSYDVCCVKHKKNAQ